ncbi:hypothetical protein [Roseisolibacter sp. H3M3-2]|uniref:hypothetical protein n=1 Tax=Roseisolibacter sp. H3M3-2 TaxID=3031323 RepID=UPI0023DB3E7C|nr:hypothetical protein [Roseisolibacter sp. H3M3-2]MDF1502514.1 hypothetical protein [Roseisolibacter sp. H3M3-2]
MLTSTALASAGVWVLAQATVLGDTVVMKQAPSDPGWFEQTTQILDAVLTLTFIALAAAVIPAAWNFRQSYKKISDLLDRVYADVNPITHHVSRITENVDYVSTAIRGDVQRASALVNDAERRLQRAVERAELRARELEALLEVAQGEAEDTLVTADAAVRGLRASVASLGDTLGEALLVPSRPPRAARRVALADEPAGLTGDLLDDELLDEEPLLAATPAPGGARRVSAADALRARAEAEAMADADDLLDLPYDDDLEEDPTDADEDDLRGDAPERPRVRPRRGRA